MVEPRNMDPDRSSKRMPGHARRLTRSHMPPNSLFFEKVIPIALLLMGIVTVALILFAAAVLLGLVRF